MSFPQSIYTQFIALQTVLSPEDQYQIIIQNNPAGQAIYIGRTIDFTNVTNTPVWAITQLIYDVNGFLTNVNIPRQGQGFKYIWDNRATYF